MNLHIWDKYVRFLQTPFQNESNLKCRGNKKQHLLESQAGISWGINYPLHMLEGQFLCMLLGLNSLIVAALAWLLCSCVTELQEPLRTLG